MHTAEDQGADCGAEPALAGMGELLQANHVRKLFHRLDGSIRRRIWSHRYRRWRCAVWKKSTEARLYGEYGLVNLIQLIPSLASQWR